MNSTGPNATTAGLAGAQPIEENTRAPPGAFPEEPAAGIPTGEFGEKRTVVTTFPETG